MATQKTSSLSIETPAALLDAKTVAQILGLKNHKTLEQWRCHDRYALRYVRVGRKILYRPQDVQEFIDSRVVSGKKKPRRGSASGRRGSR